MVGNSGYLDRRDYPRFAWHLRTLTARVDFRRSGLLSYFLPPTLQALELAPVRSWMLPCDYSAVRSALSELAGLHRLAISFSSEPDFEVPRYGHWVPDIIAILPRPCSVTHISLEHCVLTETVCKGIQSLSSLVDLYLSPAQDPLGWLDANDLLDSALRSISSPSFTRLVLDLANIHLDCTSISRVTSLRVLKVKMSRFTPTNLPALVSLVNLRKIRIRSPTLHHILSREIFFQLIRSWPRIHQVFFPFTDHDVAPSALHLADLAVVSSSCPSLRKLELRMRTDEDIPLSEGTSPFHPRMRCWVESSDLWRKDAHRIVPFLKVLAPLKMHVSDGLHWLSVDRLGGALEWRVQYVGELWEGSTPPRSADFDHSDSEFDEEDER